MKAITQFFQKISTIFYVLRFFSGGIVLIAIFAFAIFKLPQGQDVLVQTMENQHWFVGIAILSTLFIWSYLWWYSSYILSLQQGYRFEQQRNLQKHLPRIFAFSVYSVFIIGYLGTTFIWGSKFNDLHRLGTIILCAFYYWGLNRFASYLILKFVDRRNRGFSRRLYTIYKIGIYIMPLLIISFGLMAHPLSLVIGAFLMQGVFFLLVSIRYRIPPLLVKPSLFKTLFGWTFSIFRRTSVPFVEFTTFSLFTLIAIITSISYLFIVSNINAAIAIGTLAVVMLTFGFFAGIFNLIGFYAYMRKINFFLVFALLLIVGGVLFEPHKVSKVAVENNHYETRLNFDDFLYKWLERHQATFSDSSISEIPMIFVHADGGASRSGYWTASVLARLNEMTEGAFHQHLFALSGASGGSVGNVTYLASKAQRLSEVQPFLKQDFLAFPIARMLGIDMLNIIYPFTYDRARALEIGMENHKNENFISNNFSLPFSQQSFLRTQEIALCINITRATDGAPAMLSNIKFEGTNFIKRVQISDYLATNEDIRLSTAVVLGARFPYMSPAGCLINNVTNNKDYFVDGGYFDNSGASIIQEMITEMNVLMNTQPRFRKLINEQSLSKLKVVVLHVTNTIKKPSNDKKLNALANDLLAPLITLAGSYSSQTSIKNELLKNYIQFLSSDATANQLGIQYENYEVNLSKDEWDQYPMNWTISQSTLDRMNQRLASCDVIDTIARSIILPLKK